MKRFASLVLGLLLSLTVLTAAGGTAEDPLISLSYLTGEFSQALNEAAALRLESSDAAIRAETAVGPQQRTLKEGDVLQTAAGQTVTLLSGEARLDVDTGTVIDVTTGTEHASGELLQLNHRYITAENTAASVTVTTPAAVLAWEGGTLTRSLSTDYYDIARALRDIGLFRGSGSAIGEGFDLSRTPTRGEGLVMFLRILGEEPQALACELSHPFTDVPSWLAPYVSWAYQQGYTSGVAPTRFGGSQPLTAVEYVEFLLRALGYSEAGTEDYTTSLDRALTCGALTTGEHTMLKKAPFLRAHVAYLSYYALDVPLSGESRTLAGLLAAAGTVQPVRLTAARTLVTLPRIS